VVKTTTGFSCRVCAKEFSRRWLCSRHVKETHMNQGQFCCPYCNKSMHRSKIQAHTNQCQQFMS